MAERKFESSIKSLLHFDFPYFREANDGLRDEIQNDIAWQRNGGLKFAGSASPCDVAGSPKFGYRCPQFEGANTFINALNTSGLFTLDKSGDYEIEFFLRVTNTTAGRIFALKVATDYTFALAITSDLKLTLGGETSTGTITLNTWTHILIRITGGKLYVFKDGTQILLGNFNGAECNQIELGGFYGNIDEFVFRHSARNNFAIPTEPYQAIFDISQVNSFGNKKHGTQEIKSECVINSTGIISQVNGRKITVPAWTLGKINVQTMTPSVDDELMIHVTLSKGSATSDTGLYAFRKITAISGGVYTLDNEITSEFNLSDLIEKYYVQAVLVPNFESLTITDAGKINASQFNTTTGGGIIALRASNNLTVNGKIISSGYGPVRSDYLQLTHAGLISNFVLNSGGGIFIAAKNFNASSSARIGASWSGDGDGNNGAAGYGARGANWYHRTYGSSTGGAGGVGGGGGAGGGSTTNRAHKGNGANAGYPDATGGGHGWGGSSGGTVGFPNSGGTQGVQLGGNSAIQAGGAGAGGSCVLNNVAVNHSGANVIILAEKFSCDSAAISTGGKYASETDNTTSAYGGGGSGFCYIACKEMN